jgi:hypothetical protein
MKTFETEQDIMDYLEENKSSLNDNNECVTPLLVPVFVSKLTEYPNVMIKIHRWLDLETDCNFGYMMRSNQNLLREYDLNLYKFKILCEYRGPLNEEDFLDDTVRAKPKDEYIVEAAKHKDFPQDGKDIMYAIHNDIEYLSNEAKEMFIF